jgi:transposase
MSYSVKFRSEVLNFCKGIGNTIRDAAKIFNISTCTINNWKKLFETTASLEAKTERSSRKIKPEEMEELLNNQPDLMQHEIAKHFNVTRDTVSRTLKRLGYKRKKKITLYKERCEKKRQIFLERIKNIPEDSIVYVDESGFNEHLYREYCYALPGVKVVAEISGKKSKKPI